MKKCIYKVMLVAMFVAIAACAWGQGVAFTRFNQDLVAVSLTGATTPSVGSGNPYVITVRNAGLNSVSNYTVKLMQTGNVELGSAAGTTLAPQGIREFTISWIPTVLGETQIWGKVVLAGDENPGNNQTAPLMVTVMEPGLMVVGIGDGTATNTNTGAPTPYGTWYKAFRQQFLYKASELYAAGALPGMISALGFNVQSLDTCSPMSNFRIRLKETNLEALSSTFVTGEYTTVWQRASFMPDAGWNTHSFDEPFLWDGDSNLIVEIVTDLVAGSYSRNALVYYSNTGFTSSLRYQSDSSNGSSGSSGTTSNDRSNIRFFLIPGGVGHITGTVLDAGGSPLPDVLVSVDLRLYTTMTNAQGQFSIVNVLPNDFAITFSRHGYVSQIIDITLEGNETEVMDVNMDLMAQVNVSGTILASDTGSGIAGANITLVGYENYSGSSAGNGSFSIPTVFANHSYAYSISAAGYTSTSGTIEVGAANHSMGDVIMSEIAYAPNSVAAEVNMAFNGVNLSWDAPNPNAIEITEGFEAPTFPPADWSRIITNAGAANSLGVLPTWCSFGTISISGSGNVAPTEGSKQAGLWWAYAHQDEWLLTPSFNCPPDAYLSFDTYATLGSPNGDHYYVKISSDGGNSWTVLWDASAGAAGANHYEYPIMVNLAGYAGLEIKLAFHASDPPSGEGLWYEWFIDNIYIGNFVDRVSFATAELTGSKSLNSSPARGTNRTLTGYKVWRLADGQENNEPSWISLTDDMITGLSYEDQGWTGLPNGSYKWAIRAIYTADVASAPAFSNSVVKEILRGNIVGLVKRASGQGISGATVTAEGGFIATTNSAGAYILNVPAGIYRVSAVAEGFDSVSHENFAVTPNQNSTLNFTLTSVSNEDEIVPVSETVLRGNYPNPFNPTTTISYDIKDAANVRLSVYNLKGQLVRSLVDADQGAGRYRVVFDARDDKGNPLSSGIYLYRFSAGKCSSTRKMMLME